MIEAISRNHCN